MTPYQQYIHKSRYSRWLEDEKRRETWPETVQRYIDFFDDRFERKHTDILNGKVKEAILNLDVMPSMRAMMSAGPALERENLAGFNCSYLAVNTIESFSEALYILMCGTGVGFSCERQEISQLPNIPQIETDHYVIEVGDSKEGWATAYKTFINLLYDGRLVDIDYSLVRPAGARLKVFGGRASGPAPLQKLFKFTKEVFMEAQGRRLNSIEVHDLVCMIGEIVVVGGVRRSALISLSNLSDQRMRDAKVGAWYENNAQRGLANNSVAYTEKPAADIFMDEWLSLMRSGSGERGIFNRVAAGKQAAKWGRRDPDLNYGCNPCCFTGDMELLTDKGYYPFKSLVDMDDFKIISSDNSVVEGGTVWSSGLKETVQVMFSSDRNPIICTPDHIFQLNDGSECEAKDLKGKRLKVFVGEGKRIYSDDDILAGFILGDGALNRLNSPAHKGIEVFFEEKDKDVADIFGVATRNWYSRRAREVALAYELPAAVIGERGFPNLDLRLLKGLYTANGCVIKGHRVALKSIDKEQIEEVQFALKAYDIKSYITTNKPKKVKFKNGEYLCKESYDLNISTLDGIVSFAKNIGFVQSHKTQALNDLIIKKSPYVRAVKDAGVQEVFDFTEPKNHWGVVEGMVVHNSEIILRDKQLCNLSEVIIRSTDNLEHLMDKVEIATILGTLQSSLNDFGFVSGKWAENTAEEALLGVSFTGIMDNPVMSGAMKPNNNADLTDWLNILRDYARETSNEWAKILKVNPSTAITCVKPSGTVSQLCDTASGIHTRHNEHYIRTVRVDKKDPLYQFMIDQGFHTEDEEFRKDTTAVVSFPIKAPEGAVVRRDQSAMEALDLWLLYQREWCEHKPSVTITVKEDEWVEVGAWVYKHFDEVSGISFLPHTDHTYVQAPYQDLTPNEYDEWIIKHPMPEIDWDALSKFEQEDNTISSQTLACVGGSCEL